MLRGRGSKKRINYHLVGDTLFSSVPPSNSLVSISNPWRAFQRPSRTLDTPIALLPEPQRYKDSVRYDGLGADIQRQRQENLTQNLIFVFPKIWGGVPLAPFTTRHHCLRQQPGRQDDVVEIVINVNVGIFNRTLSRAACKAFKAYFSNCCAAMTNRNGYWMVVQRKKGKNTRKQHHGIHIVYPSCFYFIVPLYA